MSEASALRADSPGEAVEEDLEGTTAPASGDGSSSTGSEGRRAATAFTIELDKDDEGDGSVKKLDITGPLSKWAPKHRRNLSLTKVEENKVRNGHTNYLINSLFVCLQELCKFNNGRN